MASEGPGAPKRTKRECSYQTEWKNFGVSASRRGPNFAHCDHCGTEISIGHGGVYDVKKHLATAKHQEMVKHSSGNRSLRTLFAQSPIEESVTRAEVLFANFVAEHNLSFLLADHFTHLTSVVFPDKIAKSFRSARTKTCVVIGALLPTFLISLLLPCVKVIPFLSCATKETTMTTRILPYYYVYGMTN